MCSVILKNILKVTIYYLIYLMITLHEVLGSAWAIREIYL